MPFLHLICKKQIPITKYCIKIFYKITLWLKNQYFYSAIMRNFIIGLSILFFTLSGIITFKTLDISFNNTPYQNNPKGLDSKDPLPQVEDMLGQVAKEQEAEQTLITELQATIARLEDELADKKEEIQVGVEADGSGKEARVLAVLGSGAFASGQVVIDENRMNAVAELVPDILASPNHRVIIEGHTDNIPVTSYSGKRYRDNMELSFLRAKAVALILEKNGIPLERISLVGYGDSRPVASNETDEGRVKNRRVEIKLIPGDKDF